VFGGLIFTLEKHSCRCSDR